MAKIKSRFPIFAHLRFSNVTSLPITLAHQNCPVPMPCHYLSICQSPFATRYSLLATVSFLSQNFRQPFNGFCDFAPFGIQFLWVTLVIGLAADETVKGR